MTFLVFESRLLALMLLSLLEALRDGYCSMRRAAGFPYYPFYAIVVHIVGASSVVRPSSLESNIHGNFPIMLVHFILSYLLGLVAAIAIPATAPPYLPQSLTAG